MSVPFPSVLPRPSASVMVDRRAPMLRTQFEGCEAAQRRQGVRTPRIVKLSWSLTDRQYAIFQLFNELTLKHGAARVVIKLQLGERTYDEDYTVRLMSSAISASRDYPYWNVTATVEVPETLPMSLDEYEVSVGLAPGGIPEALEITDRFHRIVHTDWPVLSQTPLPTQP